MLVGIQQYCFHLIYQRDGRKWSDHLDEILGRIARAGIGGWEQSIHSADEARAVQPLLQKHGLKMQSIYANSKLHLPGWEQSVESVLNQARWARPLGVQIVVVNPEPIKWGGPENKSDEQLKLQAHALQTLGEKLSAEGMKLAYHTHDPEMRCAAREFHHMLLATDPQHVGLCLDSHWIYRGAENSTVALGDILKLHAPRILSLHLRQSQNGIWSESFGDGDIDYRAIAALVKARNISGPLIIEQCFEKGTPFTMNPDDSIRKGRDYVRDVFGA